MTDKRTTDDDAPVTGGVPLPRCLVASSRVDDSAPDDDLGRQAYWLLKLNCDSISLKFRKSDLSRMDDDTKRLLISDIQHALGVKPFKSDVL
jgi:hypothetical protein